MSEFYVGQKVICVDAKRRHPHKDWPLVQNQLYTITGFYTHPVSGILCATLDIQLRAFEGAKIDWRFATDRFKPLETKAIAIFRAIAANPKAPLPGQPTKENADLDLSQAISQPFSLR